MREITLGHGRVATVDDEDYPALSLLKWHAIKQRNYWYARTSYSSGPYETSHLMMHCLVLGIERNSQIQVDHISRNTLDNRKCNLRLCTPQQNSFNRAKQSNNTSGYKGVYWSNRAKKWVAQIKINQKMNYLGCFNSKENAAIRYNEEAIKLFGEFAYLNEVGT